MTTKLTVRILSGAPGSGKSLIASDIIAANPPGTVEVFSADHFFMKDGVYNFDLTQIGDAHKSCLRGYAEQLYYITERDFDKPEYTCIVDNTNIDPLDIAAYYDLARAYDINVFITTVRCDPKIAFTRNVHRVPWSTVQSACTRLENRKLSYRWNEQVIRPYGNDMKDLGEGMLQRVDDAMRQETLRAKTQRKPE